MIVALALSVAFPVCFVVLVIGCLDCLVRKRRLEGFRSRDATDGRHTNAFSVDICDVPNTSEQVTIEPLPDILSKVSVAPPLRPQITFIERGEHASTAPLISVQRSFPRDHLTYLNEIGSGWFGKAIESEAIQIVGGSQKSHVVVKMLKDDASKQEQKQFLDEVHAYRCLDHANLMSLLGQCTEATPFLVILEFAVHGNLKSFLVQHSQDLEIFVTKNRYISLALDAAAGLACLHRHDYIHNDFAARNCLVMSDYTLKIGDYGISDTLFKNEYYSTGTDLLPVRWMAPETLVKSNGVWTTKPHNKTSDMWSFGILLWEICCVGERPYDMLTDEAVLQGVIQDRLVLPSDVDIKLPLKNKLWSIMTQCWQDASSRLDVIQAYNSLEQLAKVRLDTTVEVMCDFEQKWNQLKANQEGVTHSNTDLGSRIALAGSFATDDSSSPPDKPSLLDGDAEAQDSINSDDLIIDVGADDTFTPAYQSSAPVFAYPVNAAENPGQHTIQHKSSSSSEDQIFVENEFTNTSVSQSHMTPIKSFDQTIVTTGTPILHNQSSNSGVSAPNSYNSVVQTTDIERDISPIFQEAKVKGIRSVNNDLSLDFEGHSLHKLTSTTQETSIKNFDSRMQADDEDFSDFVRTSPSAPSLDFTDFASADNSVSAQVEHIQNDVQFGEVAGSDVTGSVAETLGTVDDLVGAADENSSVDNDINVFSDFVTSDPPNKPGSAEIIQVNLDTTSNDKSPGLAESFIRKENKSELDDNIASSDNDSDAFSDFVSSVPPRIAGSTSDVIIPDARLESNIPDARLEANTPDARLEANTPDARLESNIPDARLEANTPDARLEANTPDARLESNIPDARLESNTPVARLESNIPDAKLESNLPDARLESNTPDARLESNTPDARLESNTLEGSNSKDVASLTHDLSLDMSFFRSGPETHNQTENLSTPAPGSNADLQVQGSLKDFEYDIETSSTAVDFDVEKTSLEKIEADHNQNIFSSEQFPSNLSSLISDMSFLIHDVNAATSNGILPVESKQQEVSIDVQQKLSARPSVEESHHALETVAAEVLDQGKSSPSYVVDESNISLESFEVLDGMFPSVAATSTDPAFVGVSEKKDDDAKQESGSRDVQPSISFELLDSQLTQKTDTSSLSMPVENLGKQASTEASAAGASEPQDDLLGLDLTSQAVVSEPQDDLLGLDLTSQAVVSEPQDDLLGLDLTSQAVVSEPQDDLLGLDLTSQAVVSHAQEGDLLADLQKPNRDADVESFEVLDGTFPSVAATSTDPAFVVSEKKDDDAKQESGSHDVQPSISFELLDSQLTQKTDTSSLSMPVENLGKQASTEASAAGASEPQDDLLGLDLTSQAVVSEPQDDLLGLDLTSQAVVSEPQDDLLGLDLTSQAVVSEPQDDLLGLDLTSQAVVSHAQEGDLLADLQKPNRDADVESFEVLDGTFPSVAATSTDPAFVVSEKKDDDAKQESGSHDVQPSISFELLDSQLTQKTDTSSLSMPVENLGKQASTEASAAGASEPQDDLLGLDLTSQAVVSEPQDDLLGLDLTSQAVVSEPQDDLLGLDLTSQAVVSEPQDDLLGLDLTSQAVVSEPQDDLLGLDLTSQAVVSHAQEGDLLADLQKPNRDADVTSAEQAEKSLIDF